MDSLLNPLPSLYSLPVLSWLHHALSSPLLYAPSFLLVITPAFALPPLYINSSLVLSPLLPVSLSPVSFRGGQYLHGDQVRELCFRH